jgi:hypothetical protein
MKTADILKKTADKSSHSADIFPKAADKPTPLSLISTQKP